MINELKHFVRLLFDKRKIFCVGANKTGTTSIEAVFIQLGLKVGDQHVAEKFLYDWANRDFSRLIKYCRWAEAFQDIPFSYPDTYRALDIAYPGSKFILTVRDSAEDWYDSLVRFHARSITGGQKPTADQLKNHESFHYPKGYLWDAARLRYGVTEENIYDKSLYISCYEKHNQEIMEYFKDRPKDLLVMNVSSPDSMRKLMEFLGYTYRGETMPHLNSTAIEAQNEN